MKIEIRTHAVELSLPIRQQIERRLYIALRSFARRIDEVVVSIRDVNGPRGGQDMLGQVFVRLRRGDPIVVRAKHASVHPLLAQLALTARRAVKSRIRRSRTRSIRDFRRRQRYVAVAPTDDSARARKPAENQPMQLAN